MMAKSSLRRADVLTAPVFLLLGALVAVAGLRMPHSGTYAGRPITWYTSPGFFPILLGSMLSLCAVGVLWRALREGGQHELMQHLKAAVGRALRSHTARRTLAIVALLAAYVFGIALNPFGPLSESIETKAWTQTQLTRFLTEPDGVNYLLCSLLFLASTMLLFYRPANGRWTGKHVGSIVFLAALLSWMVSVVFTELLYTPLP
jgi:hypothetical protein